MDERVPPVWTTELKQSIFTMYTIYISPLHWADCPRSVVGEGTYEKGDEALNNRKEILSFFINSK